MKKKFKIYTSCNQSITKELDITSENELIDKALSNDVFKREEEIVKEISYGEDDTDDDKLPLKKIFLNTTYKNAWNIDNTDADHLNNNTKEYINDTINNTLNKKKKSIIKSLSTLSNKLDSHNNEIGITGEDIDLFELTISPVINLQEIMEHRFSVN